MSKENKENLDAPVENTDVENKENIKEEAPLNAAAVKTDDKAPPAQFTASFFFKIAILVVLYCVTLGFWTFYWVYRTTKILNVDCSRKPRSAGKQAGLCAIPFYFCLEWADRSAECVDTLNAKFGRSSKIIKFSAVLVFFCPLAYLIVLQLHLNKLDADFADMTEEKYNELFADEIQSKKEDEEADKKIAADKDVPPDGQAILEVRHLKKYFTIKKSILGSPLKQLRAVDNVSFKLNEGETLGIVGESGCGKTTMGRTILKLHQPTGGQVFFEGKDIAGYRPKEMRPLRTDIQIIFQDPYSSLPPRNTVGDILSEAVKVHNIVPKEQVKDYVLKLMEQCGLRDYYYDRYPHEFSGGQRQRICIARALSVNPKLVVCDEPVSALDVSIQAQIINLLKRLQQQRKLTYLFISHDLSVVKHISDKIGVMYLGTMVEFGTKDRIFANPMHPYTQALFSAVPVPDPDEKMNRIILKGDIPSPANPPKGCKFHTRCPKAMEICKHVAPCYKEYEEGHFVACHCYSQEQ